MPKEEESVSLSQTKDDNGNEPDHEDSNSGNNNGDDTNGDTQKQEEQQQQQQEIQMLSTADAVKSETDTLVTATGTGTATTTADDETTPNKKATPPELPLDWATFGQKLSSENVPPIRYPSDVMEFPKDETYLEIIGTSGQKITHMGKDLMRQVSSNITHLVLRSHIIHTMEGIRGMKDLELLELYDNQIEYLNELDADDNDEEDKGTGFNIKTMDMSYNVIRDMEPVIHCPNLVDLYLANNKIKKIDGLSALINLRKIDLGANRIRIMDETQLGGLINLEELWLGKNKIEKIQGLSKLKKLRRLDVQSNRLTYIDGLEGQIDSLEELYLAHNGIDDAGAMMKKEDGEGGTKWTGLQLQFKNLTTLDLSKNRLTSCRPFAHLDTLNELWLSLNNISSFDDVQPISRLGTRDGAELTEIYLEHNPVYKEFEYRKKLKEMIPSLIQIDANVIGATGYGSVAVTPAPEQVLEQMRLLQDKVIERAKEEIVNGKN